MISDKFIFFGLALQVWGCSRYAIDTYKGITKPNRVTWFLWFLAPVIAFFAELDKGVTLVSLMTLSVGLSPLVVLIVSFTNKNAYWELRPLDYLCGFLSLVGITLWLVFREGNIAIVLAIAADLFAALPTLAKAWKYPETETVAAYSMAIINSAIALLVIKHWTVANYGFPVYIFIVNILFTYFIFFKPGKKLAGKPTAN